MGCYGSPASASAPATLTRQAILLEGLDRLPGSDPADAAVVATRMARGQPGETVIVELQADRMTGLRVSGGDAVLIDICWSEIAADAGDRWELVPDCPQPLSLPVRDPLYPAWPDVVDLQAAEAVALSRVKYGPAADWAGAPFADLHDTALALVRGGPAAGAMDAPTRARASVPGTGAPADPKSPALASLHPLDLALIGAVHRPIAEMLGLSWTDQQVRPGEHWDYMIVADHAGVAGGDPLKLLSHLAQAGFDAGTDAWIVYDQEIAVRPPFAVPTGIVVQALPGGPMRTAAGDVAMVPGSAGIDWERSVSPFGWLDPGSPVAHHVYRDAAGNGAAPVVPAEASTWLTKNRPVLLVTPGDAATRRAQRPASWPPEDPAFLDLRLAEGWYVYQVVAVDIFGASARKAPSPHGGNGHRSRCRGPGTTRAATSRLRCIRRRCASSTARRRRSRWHSGFRSRSRRSAAGAGRSLHRLACQLGCRWGRDHRVAHKLALEPGAAGPGTQCRGVPALLVGRHDATCGLARRLRLADTLCRLPLWVERHGRGRRHAALRDVPARPGGGRLSGGVPLAPTLADPIAYANVSVTAADAAAHASDGWPGGGALGNRAGQESSCAPPQKVFRVWRQPPPPPLPVVDSERVYATAGRLARPLLRQRALGAAGRASCPCLPGTGRGLFEADWAAQPRPPPGGERPGLSRSDSRADLERGQEGASVGTARCDRALLPAAPSDAQKAAANRGPGTLPGPARRRACACWRTAPATSRLSSR